MEPIDPGQLSHHVRQRLDELFPEAGGPLAGVGARVGAADLPLSRLKRIARSLEADFLLNQVRAYAEELSKLGGVTQDKHLRILIQVQAAVCRRLVQNPRRLDSAGLALLTKAIAAMERLNAGEPPPASEKDRLVRALVGDFHAWKEALMGGTSGARAAPIPAAPTASPPKRGEADARSALSAGAAGRTAYYMIPVQDLDDLKRWFQQEIVRLRKEMVDLLRQR